MEKQLTKQEVKDFIFFLLDAYNDGNESLVCYYDTDYLGRSVYTDADNWIEENFPLERV